MTGRNVRVRNLALARARHLDGHGAAIRAEGRNLSLGAVLIEDNQDGIFAPGLAGGVLRIERSIFRSSGARRQRRCAADPRHRVRGRPGQGCDPVRRRLDGTGRLPHRRRRAAGRRGGDGRGRAAGRAQPRRGRSGPRGYRAAVLALPSDSTQPLVVTGNQLEGDGLLLLNWSGQDMRLAENRVPPDALEASHAGAWWFALRQWLRSAWQDLRERAREALQLLRAMVG